MSKNTLITTMIILAVIGLSIWLINKPTESTDAITAKCIGENSMLYVQLGCTHCKTQEAMFGENINLIKKVDCFYEPDKCQEISGTPTWVINNQKYVGVQSIEKLKQLTGC